MSIRLHTFGASGSGTTTLGRRLADRISGRHLDTDAYYWYATDPPFTRKREPAERVEMIRSDTSGVDNWVLSGSICSWGDPLLASFTLAVFVVLDPDTRMRRLALRERDRYGPRILPGGDMYAQHLEFMTWARSYDKALPPTRSRRLHEAWLQQLSCPVVRVDAAQPIDAQVELVLARLTN
ncbi:MAG: AAA family ATPase [Pseudomonadota bacterium]